MSDELNSIIADCFPAENDIRRLLVECEARVRAKLGPLLAECDALKREIAEQASRETAWARKFEDQIEHHAAIMANQRRRLLLAWRAIKKRLRAENARLLAANRYNTDVAAQALAAREETQAAWESLARRQAEELAAKDAQVPGIGSDSALLDALIDAATGQDVEFSPVDSRIPSGRWRLCVGNSFYVGASPRNAIRVMQEGR
jgi:hypothetical protein